MRLMRERNVSQRLLFYTEKQMLENEKNTENNHLRGYIFYVFLPLNLKFLYLDIHF